MICQAEIGRGGQTVRLACSGGVRELAVGQSVRAVCVLDGRRQVAAATAQAVYIFSESGALTRTLGIPPQFPRTVGIHDIYYEQGRFTVILAQYKGYDIACCADPLTGRLESWHYVK